jgi:integrase
VKSRRLASNTAAGVEGLPRKTAKKHIYLDAADVERLANAAGEHRVLVPVLAYRGLRWGEAIVLRTSDVEFLRRRISVNRNAVQVGVTHQVGPTKGKENRSVPVPQFVLDAISIACQGRRNQMPQYSVMGAPPPRPKSSNGWLTRAVKAAGVQSITPHDLRHTAASLAVPAGANVLAVSRTLGHKSAALTLDTYADLFDSDYLEAVATALDAAREKALQKVAIR